jgi:hypothetical protein
VLARSLDTDMTRCHDMPAVRADLHDFIVFNLDIEAAELFTYAAKGLFD